MNLSKHPAHPVVNPKSLPVSLHAAKLFHISSNSTLRAKNFNRSHTPLEIPLIFQPNALPTDPIISGVDKKATKLPRKKMKMVPPGKILSLD
jgi:hypothetical protein